LQFKDYLKNDYQEISEGFNEKTLFSLQLQQHQIWLNAYKEFFQKSFISINSVLKKKDLKIDFLNKIKKSLKKITQFKSNLRI